MLEEPAGATSAPTSSAPSAPEQAQPVAQSTGIVSPGSAAPGPQAPGAAGTPSSPGIRAYLTSQGVDTSRFQTDDDATKFLWSAAQQGAQRVNELRPMADLGRRMAPHSDKFEQWLQQQEAQAAAPAKPKSWEVPEYDQRWEQHCEFDAQRGMWKAPDDMPQLAPVADRLNRYYDWQRNTARQMVTDPWGSTRKAGFDDWWQDERKKLTEEWQQSLAGERSRYQAQQYVDQRKGDLFRVDPAGNVLLDPATGEPALTPKGAALREHLSYGEQTMGIRDENALLQYAERMVRLDEFMGKFGQQAQSAGNGQQAASPTPEQRRGEFLQQAMQASQQTAAGGGAWTGTEHGGDPNAPRQNPDAHFGEMLDQEMRAHGLIPRASG